MLNFKIIDGRVAEVSAEYPKDDRTSWTCRSDWKTKAEAALVAAEATILTGERYIATDTPGTWPQFDVIRAPKVGDEVSYAFNGDYYPDGKIVRVSESLRVVTTDSGKKYYRRGSTASWVQTGGTWVLVPGHINKRNPSF